MRARTADVTLPTFAIAAWAAIGAGAAVNSGSYATRAIELVSVGVCLLAVGALRPVVRPAVADLAARLTAVAALLGVLWEAVSSPAGAWNTGAWVAPSHVLTIAATALAAGWLIARLSRAWLGATVVIALQALAGIGMIRSSPRPPIDDWVMFQAVTRAMTTGRNLYTVRWIGPPHEASNMFAYLPGSAVFLWPFRPLFGDVRYGILAGLVVVCALLVWTNKRSPAALLGCLPLLFPQVLNGVDSSWIDPLVLLGICAAAAAVRSGHCGWAVVSLAFALSCKQQAWLVLPLAVAWREFRWRRALTAALLAVGFTLPWALTDFHAFFYDVFQYQLRLPARLDSLSLYPLALAYGGHPVLAWLVVATVCALLLTIWRLPRDSTGFLFGAAVVEAVFNLTNKQSFFNEWELAAGLAAAAAALATGEHLNIPHATRLVGRDASLPRFDIPPSPVDSLLMEETCP